jgi:hypothetical protein
MSVLSTPHVVSDLGVKHSWILSTFVLLCTLSWCEGVLHVHVVTKPCSLGDQSVWGAFKMGCRFSLVTYFCNKARIKLVC